MVVDVINVILLVLIQNVSAGHPRDDGQVCWWSLGYRGITPV